MNIQKNSRQIPRGVNITSNKKYVDSLYGYLQSISEWEGEERFINKKDVNYTSLAKLLSFSRQTVGKYFKDLLEIGLIREEGDKYILAILPEKESALVECNLLRYLSTVYSRYTITIYIYLLIRYLACKETDYEFMLHKLKDVTGMSLKSHNNNSEILDVLATLKTVGLIDYSVRLETEGTKVKKHYKILWVLNKIPNSILSLTC